MSYQGTKINPSKFHHSQLKFYLILLPLAVFMALPIIYIVSTAFKPLSELYAFPPTFLVRKPTLESFSDIVRFMERSGVPLSRYLFNTLVSSVLIVVFTVLFSLNAGYALSKKKFKAKKMIFALNTLALMFIPAALKIPKYLIIEKVGLLDTFAVLIVPALALPVGLFLVKQFIDQIPDALIESAKIDGAKDITIVTKIVAPIVIPALVTVAILAFQSSFNSSEASSLYINSDNLKTFAFFVTTLSTGAGSELYAQGMIAASTLLLFLPNLIIFIIMQSKVINTMAHSGIK